MTKQFKILIVGEWQYAMYEESFKNSFISQGHDVVKYSWKKYFSNILGRVESKFCIAGFNTRLFNHNLMKYVRYENPDIVLIWRGVGVLPSTLKKIKLSGVKYLVAYNHDDFTGPSANAPVPYHHHRLWKNFLKGAPYYDLHMVKRLSNITHLNQLGCKQSKIMQMWFVPEIHRPIHLTETDIQKYGSDIAFIGHYEPDGREHYIKALIKNGFNFKLYGDKYWNKELFGEFYTYFDQIKPVYGHEYAKALSATRIGLAFLSKINRDTHTRRCLEIPACGSVLLCERTIELQSMFKENSEAVFFSSIEELVGKVKWLLSNPKILNKISLAGQRRVWIDHHDVDSRTEQMLVDLK